MKVLILTFGTRGDVQPFVALARELRERGHNPVLAAPVRFGGLADEHGLSMVGVDDGPLRLLDAARGVGETMTGGVRAKLELARSIPATFSRIFEDVTAIATTGRGVGADVVVHNGQIIAAPHIAEKLGVPAVLALTVPMYVPTREFPWPGQSLPPGLPGPLNRATYLGMKGPAMMFGRTVDRWREAALGLPRRRGRHDPLRRPDGGPAPVLNAVSPHAVRPPADWPSAVVTTGYWFLPAPATGLSDELAAFLDAGEPPVLIGFGSMAGPSPVRTTEMVLAAVARAGVRAVLATGWGGLAATALPDKVIAVDQVPHDLLFPHVAAVVHHGGAGTTGAAAAAGRPQVICPFVADQPFWGRRMHSLGVAPAPIDQHRLTEERLATAIITAVTDADIRDRAAQLGTQIRKEHGVATAVLQLESLATTGT
ncbi:glycosyltransferase [Pseudonocardia xinjiangensis]|uniref:glycosyltransferase n=1 Tax=Pseudonocardia xinjiangensis TaxID=75289 RepID=UPI003D8EC5A2